MNAQLKFHQRGIFILDYPGTQEGCPHRLLQLGVCVECAAKLAKAALSVRQPWAWAIIHAGKPVENRDWEKCPEWRNYRGWVLIHASKGMTHDEYDTAVEFMDFVDSSIVVPRFEELQRGGVVGYTNMIDCVRRHESRWFVGQYGLVLKDSAPTEFYPCKGALGFFMPKINSEVMK